MASNREAAATDTYSADGPVIMVLASRASGCLFGHPNP